MNNGMTASVDALKAGAPSSIINISSTAGLQGFASLPGYSAAKHGLVGLSKSAALDLGADNVRVNTVMPGWVPTERQLTKWWSPEGEAQTMRDQALKKRISPDEFVQMVLFLAADDGGGCTAQNFIVDGGRF